MFKRLSNKKKTSIKMVGSAYYQNIQGLETSSKIVKRAEKRSG